MAAAAVLLALRRPRQLLSVSVLVAPFPLVGPGLLFAIPFSPLQVTPVRRPCLRIPSLLGPIASPTALKKAKSPSAALVTRPLPFPAGAPTIVATA